MDQSVESFCNVLGKSRLLPADEVRQLYQRFQAERGGRGAKAFGRWLVDTQVLTDFQLGVLGRGHGDSLFLGPYTVQERTGRGRMAGVYRAVHRLGQTVAIKVLPPSKAKDPTILGRFQREARLALKFKHPNVVRTFQVGQHNGLHYIVMEYLDGETLEDVLKRRGRLPPPEAVRLVYQALQGLQHLHEQNVVHRDLKPANLMLVPGPGPGRPDSTASATVKVLDIGLGRALFDDAPGGNFELTNEGEIIGAPEYMAPEQARDPRTVDVRADIYSLGCTLYHALGGQPPFVGASRVRLLVRHATEPPLPIRGLNPAVPEGLQQILDWMLAKDPNGRYPTPDRAAQALQVYLAAGAEQRPGGSDTRMKAYLQWLETDTVDEVAVADDAPAPPPVAPAPPRPAPARAGTAPPARPKIVPTKAANAPAAPPRPAPPPRAPVAEAVDVELVEGEDAGEGEGLGLTRRDYLLLGVGAGVVALVVLVIVLVVLLLTSS